MNRPEFNIGDRVRTAHAERGSDKFDTGRIVSVGILGAVVEWEGAGETYSEHFDSIEHDPDYAEAEEGR